MTPLPGIPGETMKELHQRTGQSHPCLICAWSLVHFSTYNPLRVQINVSGKSLTHPNVAQQKVKPLVHEWENF